MMIFWNVMLCSLVTRLSVTFIFKVEVRTPNLKKQFESGGLPSKIIC